MDGEFVVSDVSAGKDKAFSHRLEQACANHPRAPSGHGQQVWIRRALEEQFNVKLTAEGVRKWFAGEARPRPKFMTQLAQVLGVDEAWLALGIKPTAEPREKGRLNALATGAVNLVVGQIQLAGGVVAFAEEDAEFDFFTIIQGRQATLQVKLLSNGAESKITIGSTKITIVVVPTERSTYFRFFRVPSELIEQYGVNRGGFIDLLLQVSEGGDAALSGNALPEIHDFKNLDGVLPAASKTNDGTGVGTRKRRALDL